MLDHLRPDLRRLIGLVAGFYRAVDPVHLDGAWTSCWPSRPCCWPWPSSRSAGRSAQTVILALAILSIPPLARIVRASTLVYSEREFVLAARSLGAKTRPHHVREILPNVVPDAVVRPHRRGRAHHRRGGARLPRPVRAAAHPHLGRLIDEGRQDLADAW